MAHYRQTLLETVHGNTVRWVRIANARILRIPRVHLVWKSM